MPLVYTPFYATIDVLKDTSDMKWMNVFSCKCMSNIFIWHKVFKNGPSEIYGRQPLKK